MLDQVIDILTVLGVLDAIKIMALAVAAIFIYAYFTNRG